MTLALDDIAGHPDNPREDLGELNELADSIQNFGILQPIIVVPAEALLATHPQHQDAVGDRPWVVIAGHRRHAASRLAGLETVPAIARPDLVGPGQAAVAFIVENVHRAGLEPLEEARVYATIADLGHNQRDVARQCGVSQSHVSKRLALLKLPQEAQDDLVAGETTIADLLALSAVPGSDQSEVYALAKTKHCPVTTAAATVNRQRENELKIEGARKQAQAEEIPLIDPTAQWGQSAARHSLDTEEEIQTAKRTGTLVASATPRGLNYYTTTAQELESVDPDQLERRNADRLRADACAQLVALRPEPDRISADLARSVLRYFPDGTEDGAAMLQLTHAWLASRLHNSPDPASWRAELSGDPSGTAWTAWAMTVAADEISTRQTRPWGPRQADHLNRLVADAGYTLTAWEQYQLEQVATRALDSAESNSSAAVTTGTQEGTVAS